MTRESLLARTLVEFADNFDIVDVLTRLADRCVEVLDVDAAGILLASPDGQPRVMGSSSEAMRVLELFEIQAQEGPCLDCYRTGNPVVNHDLVAVGGRWPRFEAEALDAGFRSVHALPLRLRSSVIGALNLFRGYRGGIDPADVEVAQAFADVATISVFQSRATIEAQVLNEQLTYALNSRVLIEQAKGMIAERLGIDMAQSFARLREHSRNHNLRVADVASSLVDGAIAAADLDPLPPVTT